MGSKGQKFSMSRPAFAAASEKLVRRLDEHLAAGKAHSMVSFNNQFLWIISRSDLARLALEAGFSSTTANKSAVQHLVRTNPNVKLLLTSRTNRGITVVVAELLAGVISQLALAAKDPGVKPSEHCLRVPRKAVEELSSELATLMQKFHVLSFSTPDGPNKPGVWEFCPPHRLTLELRETFNAKFRTSSRRKPKKVTPRTVAAPAAAPLAVKPPSTPTKATEASATVTDQAMSLRQQLLDDRRRLVANRTAIDSEITEIDTLLATIEKYIG